MRIFSQCFESHQTAEKDLRIDRLQRKPDYSWTPRNEGRSQTAKIDVDEPSVLDPSAGLQVQGKSDGVAKAIAVPIMCYGLLARPPMILSHCLWDVSCTHRAVSSPFAVISPNTLLPAVAHRLFIVGGAAAVS